MSDTNDTNNDTVDLFAAARRKGDPVTKNVHEVASNLMALVNSYALTAPVDGAIRIALLEALTKQLEDGRLASSIDPVSVLNGASSRTAPLALSANVGHESEVRIEGVSPEMKAAIEAVAKILGINVAASPDALMSKFIPDALRAFSDVLDKTNAEVADLEKDKVRLSGLIASGGNPTDPSSWAGRLDIVEQKNRGLERDLKIAEKKLEVADKANDENDKIISELRDRFNALAEFTGKVIEARSAVFPAGTDGRTVEEVFAALGISAEMAKNALAALK